MRWNASNEILEKDPEVVCHTIRVTLPNCVNYIRGLYRKTIVIVKFLRYDKHTYDNTSMMKNGVK